MTQHLLNGAEVGAVFKQVDGKGVAQGVGRDVLLDAGLLLIVFDDLPESLTAHALAAHVHEQGIFLLIGNEPGADIPHIILQRLHCSRVQGHDALLLLAAAADKADRQIHIVDVKTDQLTDADTGGVQQLQHGVVAEALLVHAFRLFQKQLHLAVGEDLRIFPFHLHGHHALGRVCFHGAALRHVRIEGFDGRRGASDGGGAFPAVGHVEKVLVDGVLLHLAHVRHAGR